VVGKKFGSQGSPPVLVEEFLDQFHGLQAVMWLDIAGTIIFIHGFCPFYYFCFYFFIKLFAFFWLFS
jgi:hypothetical protein